MNSLEEIALKVAEEMPQGFLWSERCGWETGIVKEEVAEFARRLVAALGAQQVPIAEVASGVWGDRLIWACSDSQGSVPVGTKLFAAPVLPSVPEGMRLVSEDDIEFAVDFLRGAIAWSGDCELVAKRLAAAEQLPQEEAP